MNPTPLTEPWFERALALVQALPTRPGTNCRIEFSDGATTWHIVIEHGSVVRWGLGSLEEPQIRLRMPTDVAVAIHRPHVDGTAALAATSLIDADGRAGWPAPLDILDQPSIEDLAEVPGADLTMQVRAFDGPFGDVDYWWRFESGRSSASEFGTIQSPDISVWGPFSVVHRVRTGQMTLLDALAEGAGVRGEEGPLMLFGGLQESPEFQRAIRACGPCAEALSALGIVRADRVFRSALATLAD